MNIFVENFTFQVIWKFKVFINGPPSHTNFVDSRTPTKNWQLTLCFFYIFNSTLFSSLGFLLLAWDNHELPSTCLFQFPVFESNSKLLLPHYSLDTSQHLLPRPSNFPHLCLLFYPAFVVAMDTTPIFFFSCSTSFLSLVVVSTGELVVVLGVGVWEVLGWRVLSNRNVGRAFICFRFLCDIFTKNRSQQKTAWWSETFHHSPNQIVLWPQPSFLDCINCRLCVTVRIRSLSCKDIITLIVVF